MSPLRTSKDSKAKKKNIYISMWTTVQNDSIK